MLVITKEYLYLHITNSQTQKINAMKTEKKIEAINVKKGDKIIVTRFTMYCEDINSQAFYIKYDKRCKNKELIEVIDVRQAKSRGGNHKMITSKHNENFYFYYSEGTKFLLG